MTATITLLAEKGAPLSHTEMDNNFRALRNLVEVPTVAALRALGDGAIPGGAGTVMTHGCLAAGDGGGGVWRWDASSSASDNVGTVILPTGHVGNGRWVRVFDGEYHSAWFGADNLQAAIDAATGGTLILSPITHSITAALVVDSHTSIIGCGNASVISMDGQNVCAMLIEGTEQTRKEDVYLGHFWIKGTNNSTNPDVNSSSGIYAEQVNRITVESVRISGVGFGSVPDGSNGSPLLIKNADTIKVNSCYFHDNRGNGQDIGLGGSLTKDKIITNNISLSESIKGGIGTQAQLVDTLVDEHGSIIVSNNIVKNKISWGILLSYSEKASQTKVVCSSNIVSNCPNYGIRYDGGFSGNDVGSYGGSVVISGNVISHCSGGDLSGVSSNIQGGIYVGDSAGPVVITGNSIYKSGYKLDDTLRTYASARGIALVSVREALVQSNNIVFCNNPNDVINSATPSAGIVLYSTKEKSGRDIIVSGNILQDCLTGIFGDFFTDTSDGKGQNIAITGNSIINRTVNPFSGIRLYRTRLENGVIAGNQIVTSVTADSHVGIRLVQESLKPSSINQISNNVIKGYDIALDSTLFGNAKYGEYTHFENNLIQGCRIGVYAVVGAGLVNVLVGMKFIGGSLPYLISGSAGTIFKALSIYPHKLCYGDTYPTSGTWSVGDQVINNAPAIGEPAGWVCSVAGTPGTWRAEAVLTA